MTNIFSLPWLGGLFDDPELAAILTTEAQLKRLLVVEAAWTRALGTIKAATHSKETWTKYSNPAADGTLQTATEVIFEKPGTPAEMAEILVEASRIADAIEALTPSPADLREETGRDGVSIPALVKHIKTVLGPEAEPWVHTGLTSQDVIDTALALTLRDIAMLFLQRLSDLQDELFMVGGKILRCELQAYTRMQPALITSSQAAIDLWRKPLTRLYDDLSSSRNRLDKIQWGGAIGNRDHRHRSKLAAEFANNLGLSDPGRAWHTDRNAIVEFGSILARITNATGKLGADIALMAAIGPHCITLSGGGTSSAMPHKQNPVKAEALTALASYCATLAGGLHHSGLHEGFRSGHALSLEWIVLPQICMATGASLRIANQLASSIETIGVPKAEDS